MKTLKTFWFNLLLSLFFSTGVFAQNEANIWYFPNNCGLDFNSGMPAVLNDGQSQTGYSSSTISDSLGNFLFCCDWNAVYTIHGIMQNSLLMECPGTSGSAIVKWPSQNGLYYIFTAIQPTMNNPGFTYSVVDMKLANGWGIMTEKNIYVDAGWDVSDRIAIAEKEDSESVWVIVRKNEEDSFATFIVDNNGFNPDPIISIAPDREPAPYWLSVWGYIKISSNKKFLVSSYSFNNEVCGFNASTGEINYT
jgi:hypothetical protein